MVPVVDPRLRGARRPVISRRRFLTGVAIGLAPMGAAAHAQEYKAQPAGRVYRIGIFTATRPEASHVWGDSSNGYGNWGTSRARRSWAPGDRVAEGAYHQFVAG